MPFVALTNTFVFKYEDLKDPNPNENTHTHPPLHVP